MSVASTASTGFESSNGNGGMNWEPVRRNLLGADLNSALRAATELRERIEIVHTTEFPAMLSALLPAFSSVLSHCTRPNPDILANEHKLRNEVLEVLSRLPNNEVLRPHTPQVLAITMDVLTRDYEDNAFLAIRIIFDLHKNYRQQDQVQPFLDFVQTTYRSLPTSVQRNFLFPTETKLPSQEPAVPSASQSTPMKLDNLHTPTKQDGKTPTAIDTASLHTPPKTPTVRLALKSTSSFRVLTECPLTTMLIFQLYPKFLASNIPTLINLMVEALALRAPQLQSITGGGKMDSQNERLYFSRSQELLAGQSKTLSFLTYLLRSFADQMKPYEDRIAGNVVALMSTCPRDAITIRKELLVSTRHILATDFRKGFFRHVDSLLDERILMGTSSHHQHHHHHRHYHSTDPSLIRPLGYSTLADFVHHVRSLLSMQQLSRVVYMFSRVLHDPSMKQLPMTIQITAARLLVNIVDIVYNNKDPNPQLGRDLLVRILDALVHKLGTLKDYNIPLAIQSHNSIKAGRKESGVTSTLQQPIDVNMKKMNEAARQGTTSKAKDEESKEGESIFTAGASKKETQLQNQWSAVGLSPGGLLLGDTEVAESIRDVQSIVKSIIVGLKTVIWCINNYHKVREQVPSSVAKPAPGSNDEVTSAMQKMTNSERELVDKYITYAFPCLKVFVEDVSEDASLAASVSSKVTPSAEQYRDVLGYFSAAFSVLDGYNLRRTIGRRIGLLFDAIVDDQHVMVIPRHLLVSRQPQSFDFCDVLLCFLVERLDDLSTNGTKDFIFVGCASNPEMTGEKKIHREWLETFKRKSEEDHELQEKRAATILQLFERVLKSLSAFPENEAALRPHLQKIVATCLRSSMESVDMWPGNYFILLRFVFRSISAGKFEESYRELLPLIPTILNGLYRVFEATEDANLRHAIIELCLTIPARLSSLLPHMSLLLRIIIPALRSKKGDLVNLGLRTLEFWVDNLNPEFLYPILSKQECFFTELMTALSLHLRPAPYPYGLLTLRLLGKLGGKNRRFLRNPLDLDVRGTSFPLLSVECHWSSFERPDERCDSVEAPNKTGDSSAEGGAEITDEKPEMDHEFDLPLPLDRAVEVLKLVALCQGNDKDCKSKGENASSSKEKIRWKDFKRLWCTKMEHVDFTSYCSDVTEETKQHQAEAAFSVLRTSLAAVIELPEDGVESISTQAPKDCQLETDFVDESGREGNSAGSNCYPELSLSATSLLAEGRDVRMEKIITGLMFASMLRSQKSESLLLLKGVVTHIFLLVVSLQSHILRIDGNGAPVDLEDMVSAADETKKLRNPFGHFKLSGPFCGKADPFVLNRAIADLSCERSAAAQTMLADLLQHILDLSRSLIFQDRKTSESPTDARDLERKLTHGCDIFFENLLSRLCDICLSGHWNARIGAYDSICQLMEGLGSDWSRRFETEIMHVAVASVKSSPREVGTAAVTSFRFFTRVCIIPYGCPGGWTTNNGVFLIYDALTTWEKGESSESSKTMKNQSESQSANDANEKTLGEGKSRMKSGIDKTETTTDEGEVGSVKNIKNSGGENGGVQGRSDDTALGDSPIPQVGVSNKKIDGRPPIKDRERGQLKGSTVRALPNTAVIQLLLSEIASPKQIMRFTVRFGMQHFVLGGAPQTLGNNAKKLMSSHAPAFKRALFSRSLRLLPLPEQVGVVEALAFMINQVPGMIPISDQHLLAFLSELLKMCSIADGEMSDSNLAGLAVDKNGYAITPQNQDSSAAKKLTSLAHASIAFLRKECILNMDSDGYAIIIPEELPHGVQLRVSALKLFNAVIRRHADEFFDADSSTPIGNIRPHVISLLFRSLVSNPHQAVIAAHEALRGVLSLSILTREGSEGTKAQSRLPKELLQTCIRPVLLNLRDYTRLTVPLLRGLSRLLSLLSTWFNRTLGEKLLDHLQKWTDPERIISRQIWKQGDEPVVAAAIIGLFALLPHASQFVEPLVKTTIKLEAALPRYKSTQGTSPYRPPLAKYLNKYCEYTVRFFFARLRSPIYSELFQAIVKFDESVALREYLSGRQCSVHLLNVCFERPLAIIRSEKTSGSSTASHGTLPKSPVAPPKSAADVLAIHGITFEMLSGGSSQVAVLKRDIENKQKRLLAFQKEANTTKEALQAKIAGAASASTPESQAAVEDAKRKHKIAQGAFEKGKKTVADLKQRYAAQVAQSTSKNSTVAEGSQNTRPMSTDTLESQYQGFKLVETLVEKDTKYLRDHNDVVRAFRWLWRSKGRHLRLQHEESMPPRFHCESYTLATFLVNYSRAFPSDVDVLFELIRIFLQPTTTDFTFVQDFLINTVSNVLTIDRKKHLMQRFFALVTGEGSEETKALSIQLLVLPMLSGNSSLGGIRRYDPPSGNYQKKRDVANTAKTNSAVLDITMIRKFIKEVLFREGNPTPCGERLKIELLKLSTLLLETISKDMADYKTDLIKFPWSLLKSEHANCKNWAYVNVSRFISVFDTPAKIILQVYVALLRSHQPEGKELIRTALEILVPVLKKRLNNDDYKRAIDLTNKIIYEEGNSVPQLAHIWHIIVRHPDIFYSHCNRFTRHMINSVHRLGLLPNCPQENRALTLEIVELVLHWEERQQRDSTERSGYTEKGKRKVLEETEISSPSKKLKSDEGRPVLSNTLSKRTNDGKTIEYFLLDQSMIDTLANFIVRLKLLIGDSKVEGGQKDLNEKTTRLLRKIISKWRHCTIRAVYFEKVVSMCLAETAAAAVKRTESKQNQPEKKGKEKSKSKSGGGKSGGKGSKSSSSKSNANSATSSKQNVDPRQVSLSLLSACLDIFIIIAKESPSNSFLEDNASKVNAILGPCFTHAGGRNGELIRQKLELFLVPLFASKQNRANDLGVMFHVAVYIEKFMIDGANPKRIKDGTTDGGTQDTARKDDKHGSPSHSDEKGNGGMCLAHFSVQIIEEICESRPSFVEMFSSSMVSLVDSLTKVHIHEASSSQRHVSSSSQKMGSSGFQHMYATPIAGIMEEACSEDNAQTVVSGNSKPAVVNDGQHSGEIRELGPALKTLVTCLRLLGNSSVPFTFSERRRKFLHVLGNIIDMSDNVQVLMTAVGIVGKWLVAHGCDGPMTLKERNSFLWKIASFDFNGLSDVSAQPLADLVACVVLAIHNSKNDKLTGSSLFGSDKGGSMRAERNGTSDKTHTKACDSDDMLLGRSLVACLLCANPLIRSRLLCLYGTQSKDYSLVEKSLPGSGNGPACSEIDGLVDMGLPGRAPLDILWQLLHSDYEGLGGRLWILVFVELLLASCKPSRKVRLASKELHIFGRDEHTSTWLPPPASGMDLTRICFESPDALDEYSTFLHRLTEVKSAPLGRCLSAVKVLAHGDPALCQTLFDKLLSSAWSCLPNDSIRSKLVPAIESLLSRPFHSQFFKHSRLVSPITSFGDRHGHASVSTNVVRTFLRTLADLRPMPTLDTDLLLSVAENYNCWHEVISILEHQHTMVSAISATNNEVQKLAGTYMSAIRHCYWQLGEGNLWLALSCKSCQLPESKWAISLDMHGMVKEALEAYSSLVELVDNANASAAIQPSECELSLWEDRWIELQKEMCQWQVVSDYANSTSSPRLMLETAWKSQNWEKVKGLCAAPSLVASIESGDPTIKLSEIFLAIVDGKLSDVENLHAQTAQLCLHKWQLLPSISCGSAVHVSLLQLFHRLVELRESGQIMVETSNHSSGRTLPDLKNLLSAWRYRLPNEFENISVWDDLFLWRSHMFTAITSNFHWSDPNALASLHDRPWTAIRMSKTARKQGMREVALLSLGKLTDCAMDVSDAFSKLREQILVYNNPESELERTGGLNLVNTTNLSFFDASQKSELFRLKAVFLASLSARSKANQAYCHSVQICPSYARSWISWGGLCSSLGDITEKQREHQASTGIESTMSATAAAKKVAQYLAQALGCYIEAVRCDSNEWSRMHLPKCLWMLIKDGSSPGVLCQTLETRGASLPSWVWLPWIPQLLTSLCRIEGRAAKAILTGLVKSYPQALYFALRAFYLERRDVDRSRGAPSSSSHQGSVTHAEELMSSLRRAHPTLWTSLEAILEELIVRFRPSYEEELLATIIALLDRAETQINQHKHTDKHDEDEENAILASVSKTLGRISTKFFSTSPADAGSRRRDERAKKTDDFKRKYKAAFESDFSLGAARSRENSEIQSNLSLHDFLSRLKKWKRRLEAQVSATPAALPLIESSPTLALFSSEAPDLWAGSCDPRQSNSPSLDRERTRDTEDGLNPSSASSDATTAASSAALAVANAASKEGVGGHYGGGSAAIEIPGQYVPNRTNCLDSKPNPELHAKLVRFESKLTVLRRNEHLVRRIGMIGSDGRTYRFLLQFAIPYWTRTDERTSQLHYIVDKLLRKGILSSRSHLSVQPTAVIPIAQRLRMTAEKDSRLSLDDAYRRVCEREGKMHDSIASYFQQAVADNLEKQKYSALEGPEKKRVEKAAKLEVFTNICETMVDGQILLKNMHLALDGPEGLYQFRRSFAGQLAANSLFQYVFCVVERNPSRFVFDQQNGQAFAPDFRFAYSNQGFLEGNELPFRMTPNIKNLIGNHLLEGRFTPSMATIAACVHDQREEIGSILRLILRDDIVSWYTSKSMAKSDTKTQELEKQLADRVAKNVSLVQARFSACTPNKKKENGILGRDAIDFKVRKLLEEATAPETLCMMPTTYHPWL